MTHLDQIDLAGYLRTGDREALGRVVWRHVDFVYGVARRETRDVHLAEDVTQAVFLVLAQKASRIKPGLLDAWLFSVTRNISANALKSASRRQFHEQHAAIKGEQDMKTDHDQIEHIAFHLNAALAAVREADRSIVLMRFVQEMQVDQIGAAMGLSEVAVRKRLERTMQKLRRFLSGRGMAVGAAVVGAAIGGISESAPAELLAAASSATSASPAASALAQHAAANLQWATIKLAVAIVLAIGLAGIFTGAIWNRLVHQASKTASTLVAADAPTTAPATRPAERPAVPMITYSGTVTDPAGKPVAGVHIWSMLIVEDPKKSKAIEEETTSDADGKFKLAPLPAVSAITSPDRGGRTARTLIFDKPEFALAWRETRRDDVLARGSGGSIDFSMPLRKAVPVAVKVIDADANPIANAEVIFNLQDGMIFALNQQQGASYGYLNVPILPYKLMTDAQGMAMFARVPESSRAHVEVLHPNYVRFTSRDGYQQDEYPIRPNGSPYVAQLDRGGRINVHIAMRDGKPALQSVQITANAESSPGQSRIERVVFDRDGNYVLAGLRPGTYSLVALPFVDDRRASDLVWPPVRGVVVGGGESSEATLSPIVGKIVTGRLVDSSTKLPISGQLVTSASDEKGMQPSSSDTTTDRDGRFALRVLPGPNILHYSNYQTGQYTQSRKSFSVPDQESSVSLGDIETSSPPMTRGRLLDASGKPLDGGRIVLNSERYTTEKDGSFAIPARIRADMNFMFAFSADGTLAKAVVVDEKFTNPKLALPGAALPEIRLAGSAIITGQIGDGDGKAVSDAQLSLNVSEPNSPMSTSFSSPPWEQKLEGNRFTLSGVPIGLKMQVMLNRNDAQVLAPLDNLNPGEVRDLGDLVLKPRPARGGRGLAEAPGQPDQAAFNATFTGKVIDADSNKPLIGARVNGIPVERRSYRYPTDTTDQDGGFILSGLPSSGHVTLIVEMPGYLRSQQEIEISAPDVQVRMRAAGSELIGKPAPELRVAEWASGTPLQLSDLKGKVVLLHFGVDSRGNYTGLIDYHVVADAFSRYGPKGLMVIGIHRSLTPGRANTTSVQDVSDYVKAAEIPFPIAIDSRSPMRVVRGQLQSYAGGTHGLYEIIDQTAMVLIDKQGIVRVFPRRENLGAMIEKLLAE